MNTRNIALILPLVLFAACSQPAAEEKRPAMTSMENPLANPSTLPFHAPPFDRLKSSDYGPAMEAGMRKQLEEITAIVGNSEAPTFENTIVAMEKSGQDLTRATKIFFNLTSSCTNDSLQQVKEGINPKLTAHADAISMDPRLFARVKAVYDQRASLGLDPVSVRLIERYYTRFVRQGALLQDVEKEQLKKLNEEESKLNTKFEDNILKDRAAAGVLVEKKEQLDGLSEDAIAAAAEAAKAKGKAGQWLIEIVNTTTQPVLSMLKDRSLRERIYKASIARNAHGGDHDNRAIITRLAQLRAQKAKLLGMRRRRGPGRADDAQQPGDGAAHRRRQDRDLDRRVVRDRLLPLPAAQLLLLDDLRHADAARGGAHRPRRADARQHQRRLRDLERRGPGALRGVHHRGGGCRQRGAAQRHARACSRQPPRRCVGHGRAHR